MSVVDSGAPTLTTSTRENLTESPVPHDSRDNMQKDTCGLETTPEYPSIKLEQRSPQPAVDAHVAVRFTNFFIDEILKPHFGKNDTYHHSPFSNSLKSECSILTQKFSGIVHRPVPTFKQTPKTNSVQSKALDLTRDRPIKNDKPKLDCVDASRGSPGLCSRPKKARSPAHIPQPCVGEAEPRSPSPASSVSSTSTSSGSAIMSPQRSGEESKPNLLWPAWVYCTRYSDRPSSGPRSRRNRRKEKLVQEKRPRTAFSASQLDRLKKEFEQSRYLTEPKRQDLARELNLNESQIKIWFQNKRAKLKKSTGVRNGLAMQLMAQGLYNHSTMNRRDEEEIDVES